MVCNYTMGARTLCVSKEAEETKARESLFPALCPRTLISWAYRRCSATALSPTKFRTLMTVLIIEGL